MLYILLLILYISWKLSIFGWQTRNLLGVKVPKAKMGV